MNRDDARRGQQSSAKEADPAQAALTPSHQSNAPTHVNEPQTSVAMQANRQQHSSLGAVKHGRSHLQFLRDDSLLEEYGATSQDSDADIISWLQCDLCAKWRVVPPNCATAAHASQSDGTDARWFCSMNPDPAFASCSKSEQSEQELGVLYIVEALRQVRWVNNAKGKGGTKRRRQFLVRWKGYSANDGSWEDEENILDRKLISDFEQNAAASAGTPAPAVTRLLAPEFAAPALAPSRNPSIALDAQRPRGRSGVEVKRSTGRLSAEAKCSSGRPGVRRSGGGTGALHSRGRLGPTHSSAKRPPGSPNKVLKTAASKSQALSVKRHACSQVDNAVESVAWMHWRRAAKPRVDPDAQVELPPWHVAICGTEGGPSPPVCVCGQPARWNFNRWWCQAAPDGGCRFESELLPLETAPLCGCGRMCVWLRRRWWCAIPEGFPGCCGFESRADEPTEPLLLTVCDIEAEMELAKSALHEASALADRIGSWVDDYCFVADAGSLVGLGLFARMKLQIGQVICEYGGPRLPLSALSNERGEYALQIPMTSKFIDGNWDNSPFPSGPRFEPTSCLPFVSLAHAWSTHLLSCAQFLYSFADTLLSSPTTPPPRMLASSAEPSTVLQRSSCGIASCLSPRSQLQLALSCV